MHSGRLKVSHESLNGQEQILRTVTDGDVVGERAFLTGHRPSDLVVALEDSRMCVFDHADLAALLGDYPDISQRMLRTLSDRLSSVERLLAAVTSSDVTARVAAYLLDLPGAYVDGAVDVELPMAKQEVARYLGTTPRR
nr:Crp/Fnr family transcriptional regulator [Tessaracoccus coleopterorum]